MDAPKSLRAYDRPADRIRLHRQASSDPITVVEGQTDKRLIERLLGVDGVAVFIVGSRKAVLDVADALAVVKLKRIAYLVDRDFDAAVAQAEGVHDEVIAYDNADLEAMLFESSAFAAFLGEFANDEKVATFGGVQAVREHARGEALLVARLRRQNALMGWGCRFDEVKVADRIKGGKLQSSALVDALRAASPDSSATRIELVESLRMDDSLCPTTGRVLFKGRDALSVLGVQLRRTIGSLTKESSRSDLLERSLRLSVDLRDIKPTGWWTKLCRLLDIAS